MPSTPTMVEDTLLLHEIAATIHQHRHRGNAAYCRSDGELAQAVIELFRDHDWVVRRERSPA